MVVGDVHGRADLLQRFLDSAPSHPVVCVGDYVDRGDHSAEVLRMLNGRPDVVCLAGNHEEMMLDFIDQPEVAGARWLRHGGLQTLASFGVAGLSETSDDSALRGARQQLVKAMGSALLGWMQGLPSLWQSGNVAVVHAGADPAVPMAQQSEQCLRWGHRNFMRKSRADGVWVVHGHTIVDQPHTRAGRVAIDTGAYATGRLTVATIAPGDITFDTIT